MNIVFIDHDIDNWHANTFARLLVEEHPDMHLTGVFANRKDNLEEWAKKHQVAVAHTVDELRSQADCVMVLAPSNPETHMDLCRQAFALGKPTYVDKTFAPDVATAHQIFKDADTSNVPIQTSSVLRYTEVQEYCRAKNEELPRFIATWATGGDFEEYLIHPVEHVVSMLGHEYREIRCREMAGFRKIEINFSNGSVALINMHVDHATPFFSVVSHADETRPITISNEKLFSSGLKGILDFFRNPSQAIDRQETLAILEILESVKKHFAL